MMDRAELEELREQYRKALLDDVVAFWERHSVDREFGGFVARTTSEPSFVGVRFAYIHLCSRTTTHDIYTSQSRKMLPKQVAFSLRTSSAHHTSSDE